MAHSENLIKTDEMTDAEARRLRLEISATRDRMSETFNELSVKLQPANLFDDNVKRPLLEGLTTMTHTARGQASEAYRKTAHFVAEEHRTNPVRLGLSCLVGGFVIGYLATSRYRAHNIG